MHAWLADVDLVQLAATLAILGIIAVTIIKSWRPVRAVVRFFDAMIGGEERDRDGVKLRPGILDRMATLEAKVERIHHEVTPNTGGSLKDEVADVRRSTGRLEQAFNEHLVVADQERRQVESIAETVEDLHAKVTDDD